MCTDLQINFEEGDYSVQEGSPNPIITLDYRQTRIPFNVTLYPVTITKARSAPFNAQAFIAAENISEATPGEGVVESAVGVGNQCQDSYYTI